MNQSRRSKHKRPPLNTTNEQATPRPELPQPAQPNDETKPSTRSTLKSKNLELQSLDSLPTSPTSAKSIPPPKNPTLTPLLTQLSALSLRDASLLEPIINASGLKQALEFSNKLYAQAQKILDATPNNSFKVQGRIGGWYQGRHGGVEAGMSEAGILLRDGVGQVVRGALESASTGARGVGEAKGEERLQEEKSGGLQGLFAMQHEWEAKVAGPDLPFLRKTSSRKAKKARRAKEFERRETRLWQWLGEILNDIGADGWPRESESESGDEAEVEVDVEPMNEDVEMDRLGDEAGEAAAPRGGKDGQEALSDSSAVPMCEAHW
jgi:hypothetical protein